MRLNLSAVGFPTGEPPGNFEQDIIVVENNYRRDKVTSRRVASENLDWIKSNLNLNNYR